MHSVCVHQHIFLNDLMNIIELLIHTSVEFFEQLGHLGTFIIMTKDQFNYKV